MPLGASGEPLLIIDDFLANPDALVAAAERAQWRDVAPGGYPGRRAALPGDYARALLRRLDAPIRKRLVDPSLSIAKFECSFSMVTQRPEALKPLQRIPHILMWRTRTAWPCCTISATPNLAAQRFSGRMRRGLIR